MLKIKFILFSFILIFLMGCIKTVSNVKGTSSNNYFLFTLGSGDHNGAGLESIVGNAYISFFKDYDRFKMNYNVVPSREDDIQASDIGDFTNDITNIAKKLDEDSTFMIFLVSHGGQEGKAYMAVPPASPLEATEVMEALKKGRKIDPDNEDEDAPLKPAFKRFVMFSLNCYAAAFSQKLLEASQTDKYKNIFKEGLYIASSDATDTSINFHTVDFISQMLFLYQDFQVEKCKDPGRSINDSYKVAYDNVHGFCDNKKLVYPYSEKERLLVFERCFSSKPDFFDIDSDFKILQKGSEYIKECLKDIKADDSVSSSYKKRILGSDDKFSFTMYSTFNEQNVGDNKILPYLNCKQ